MATRKNKAGSKSNSTRKRIGPLRSGDLKKYGYTHVTTMTATKRHAALTQAIKEYGVLSVFRKLNAVYVLTRTGSPASSAVFKMDRDWVMNTFTESR
jgi:hypothetical protein